MLTVDDIIEYMPDVNDYGIIDYELYFTKSESDIYRLLKIQWWPLRNRQSNNLFTVDFNAELLDETQFTRAAVYHCLAYYIMPILSKFDPNSDRFREMMGHYKERFDEEFDLILREGVRYDSDGDNTVESGESTPTHHNRLIR